jgi:hypothetical protein
VAAGATVDVNALYADASVCRTITDCKACYAKPCVWHESKCVRLTKAVMQVLITLRTLLILLTLLLGNPTNPTKPTNPTTLLTLLNPVILLTLWAV